MKIALDFGHGVGTDRGAVGLLAEEDVINEVGQFLLHNLGKKHQVILTRPKFAASVGNSLEERAKTANSFKADLFISLHANAATNEQASGSEVFLYSDKSKCKDLANNVLGSLVRLGFKDRGAKVNPKLKVLKLTDCPSMLVELFFLTNVGDCELYSNISARKIAEAIAANF